MKRGDLVLASGRGDFSGKHRPALIVQSDVFNDTHSSVSVCPLTSEMGEPGFFRIQIQPTEMNGLHEQSEIQVDKVQSVRRKYLAQVIGRLEDPQQDQVDGALKLWLDL